MRKEVYAPSYNKYMVKAYKKFSGIKGYTTRITDSFKAVLPYLLNDLDVPDEYKAHKIVNDIWELHLVSRSSDCLLVYAKRQIEGVPVLYIYAITDHDGLSKLVKLHGECELIAEGEKAWREGDVKVVTIKQLMKITRKMHD